MKYGVEKGLLLEQKSKAIVIADSLSEELREMLKDAETDSLPAGEVRYIRHEGNGDRHIIFAACPHWHSYARNTAGALLAECYKNSLAIAEKANCGSIVFPVMGIGRGAFPADRAAKTSVIAVREYFEHNPHSCIERVTWVDENDSVLELLREELRQQEADSITIIPVTDCHMHIVWGVDDGPVDEQMSRDMLRLAWKQGIRRICATSHGSAYGVCLEIYNANLAAVKAYAKDVFPEIQICAGTEIRVYPGDETRVMELLNSGELHFLGSSNKALIELPVRASSQEQYSILQRFLEAGVEVVVAHAERYRNFCENMNRVRELVAAGCQIQVNAYSLAEETDERVKQRAHLLAKEGLIHYLGSDAHRTSHRPPSVQRGVKWLCEKDVVDMG